MNKRLNEIQRRCAVLHVSSQVEKSIAESPLELRLGQRTWTTSTWRTRGQRSTEQHDYLRCAQPPGVPRCKFLSSVQSPHAILWSHTLHPHKFDE